MTMFESFPDVMKVMDVAKALGVSRNTAYEFVHSKGFPAINVGKQIRVSKLALIAWIDEQSKAAMAS
nr:MULTISPECIES: helix-turn-helix domain-containing protein [unclassified Pseudoflavonifractor]